VNDAAAMLQRVRSGFSLEGLFEGQLEAEQAAEAFVTAIAPLATDDFVCVMDGGALTATYEGLDGLREGWRDFLGAFETIRIHPEAVYESADSDCVAEFVRLTGRPKGVAADVDQEAAAVWRLREGRLCRVEFHMDRSSALRSADIDPETAA
jgi:ketosteroid isomerase-like protein